MRNTMICLSLLLACAVFASAQVEPIMVNRILRSDAWVQASGLDKFLPHDVIQVWWPRTAGSSYVVILELQQGEASIIRSQTVTPPKDAPAEQTLAGCGFTFPDGLTGVSLKRVIVLELPAAKMSILDVDK